MAQDYKHGKKFVIGPCALQLHGYQEVKKWLLLLKCYTLVN